MLCCPRSPSSFCCCCHGVSPTRGETTRWHFAAGDFQRFGCRAAHPGRRRPLWGSTPAHRHHGPAGRHVVIHLRGRPVLWPAGYHCHQEDIRLLDAAYSARPLAAIISQIERPNKSVAMYKVRRDVEYGLSFYRNHLVDNYEQDGIPSAEHILITRESVRRPIAHSAGWAIVPTALFLSGTKPCGLPGLRQTLKQTPVRLSQGVGFQRMGLCRTLLFKRRGFGSRQ